MNLSMLVAKRNVHCTATLWRRAQPAPVTNHADPAGSRRRYLYVGCNARAVETNCCAWRTEASCGTALLRSSRRHDNPISCRPVRDTLRCHAYRPKPANSQNPNPETQYRIHQTMTAGPAAGSRKNIALLHRQQTDRPDMQRGAPISSPLRFWWLRNTK